MVALFRSLLPTFRSKEVEVIPSKKELIKTIDALRYKILTLSVSSGTTSKMESLLDSLHMHVITSCITEHKTLNETLLSLEEGVLAIEQIVNIKIKTIDLEALISKIFSQIHSMEILYCDTSFLVPQTDSSGELHILECVPDFVKGVYYLKPQDIIREPIPAKASDDYPSNADTEEEYDKLIDSYLNYEEDVDVADLNAILGSMNIDTPSQIHIKTHLGKTIVVPDQVALDLPRTRIYLEDKIVEDPKNEMSHSELIQRLYKELLETFNHDENLTNNICKLITQTISFKLILSLFIKFQSTKGLARILTQRGLSEASNRSLVATINSRGDQVEATYSVMFSIRDPMEDLTIRHIKATRIMLMDKTALSKGFLKPEDATIKDQFMQIN